MGLSKPFPFSHVGHRFPCSCFAMAVRRCTFHGAKYIARVLASSAALIAFAFMLCDGAAVLYFAPCKVHRFLGRHFFRSGFGALLCTAQSTATRGVRRSEFSLGIPRPRDNTVRGVLC